MASGAFVERSPERLPDGTVERAWREHGAPSTTPPGADDDVLFSIEPIKRTLWFALRATWRNKLLAVLGGVAGLMLAGIALLSSPPQYLSAVTILLRSEDFGGGFSAADPQQLLLASRQANGVIMRRESLDRIIDDLDLIERKPALPPFGKLTDSITGAIFGSETTAEGEMEAMRDELRVAIIVAPAGSGDSIYIGVTWPDPTQAAEIANLTFDIFYADRELAEVVPKQRAVEILQANVDSASARVDQLRADLDLPPTADAPAGSSLESATFAQRDLAERLRTAQLDLDRATNGLPFRYALLEPAEVPQAPISGNLISYAIMLVFASIVGVSTCLGWELLRRRVVDRSQIEKLGVRILAVASLPTDPG